MNHPHMLLCLTHFLHLIRTRRLHPFYGTIRFRRDDPVGATSNLGLYILLVSQIALGVWTRTLLPESP